MPSVLQDWVMELPRKRRPGERSWPPLDARFWEKVTKTAACWIWTGAKVGTGYAGFWFENKTQHASAAAWFLGTGDMVPPGMLLCHTCDDILCIRNDDRGVYVVDGVEYERCGHLWLGTVQANVTDRVNKGRQYHPNGEKHPMARLSTADVSDIRMRYGKGGKGGLTQDQLAELYGVRRSQISRIVNHVRWG